MKPLLLIAALIFASTAAQAEAQLLSTDLYECTPVYESAGARTVDEVHKTNIAVTRNKESRPIGMSVQHILVSGAVRTRNDQYATRFETDGDQFFRWSGSLNGNQRITMSGSLDRDPRSNGWIYSERQWDEGHFEWSARSTCDHVVSNATAATTLAQTENNNRFEKNAEAELAGRPGGWYFDHLQWLIYVGAACFIWMFIGPRTLEFVGYPRDTLKSRLITFVPVSCISLLFLIFTIFLFLRTALDIAGPIFRWTLDPRNWWASLPILAVVWLTSYLSKKPWRNVLAKSLQPLLVGMLIAEAIFFAANLWLPRSQDDNLRWIEKISSNAEVTLENLLPFSLLTSLLLLAAIFALNMWYPQLRAWTRRFEKSMEFGKSLVSVLAVFTSVTFFGTGGVAVLHQLTAQEKSDRLKDQATATAQRMLAARVTENPKTEAVDVKAFLDVILRNVRVDLDFSKSSKSGTTSSPAKGGERQQLDQMVRKHAREVLEYEPTLVRDAAMAIDNSRLKAILDKTLTEDQLKEAKDGFGKVLDLFLAKGAEITSHPLSVMLREAGLPEETTSIVRDLYEAALRRLSKALVDPLTDATFRPRSYEASLAPDALKRAWERPIFDEKVLPRSIAEPTVGDRRLAEQAEQAELAKQAERTTLIETVRGRMMEAVREAR